MSKKVKYELSSEDKTASGINSALNNLKRLDKEAEKITKTFDLVKNSIAVGFATKGLELITRFVGSSINEFAEMERSSIKLSAALNGNLPAINSLKGTIETLSLSSGVAKDDIENLVTELALLGKQPVEIEKVTRAATVLAEATGDSLDSAFTQLNATLSGTPGKLEKLIPELGGLSEEQLKTGQAIDYVIEKMSRYTEAVESSWTVKVKGLKDSFGDLKEAIGEGWAEAFKPMVDAASSAFKDLADLVATSNISKKIDALTGTLFGGGDIKGLRDLRAQVGQEAFAKAVDHYLKGTLGGLNANKAMVEEVKKLAAMQDSTRLEDPRGYAPRAAISLWKEDTPKPSEIKEMEINPFNIADGFEAAFNAFDFEHNFSFLTGEGSSYSEPYNIAEGFEAVFNALDFEHNYSPLTGAGSPQAQTNENFNLFGDMSAFVLLGALLTPIIGQLAGMFTSLSSVNQILNPLQTIFLSMMTVLEPIINELLLPIVGALNIIDQMLAALLIPALTFLTPVIELIAEAFVWLYNNAIRPFANMIISIATAIFNSVSRIVNGLIDLINLIPGINIAWRMAIMDAESMFLNNITLDSLKAAGASTVTNTAFNGVGASYTAQRDVIVNVYTGVVVGDDGLDTFTYMIRDKLTELSVLNR